MKNSGHKLQTNIILQQSATIFLLQDTDTDTSKYTSDSEDEQKQETTNEILYRMNIEILCNSYKDNIKLLKLTFNTRNNSSWRSNQKN